MGTCAGASAGDPFEDAAGTDGLSVALSARIT